jgi:hypothetical protein
MAAPCEWDVDPVALGVCDTWADLPAERKVTAMALASSYLWAVTGRQFGVCPVTIRPSQSARGELVYQDFPVMPGVQGLGVPGGPFLFGGRWFNSGCASACCGSSACAIVLRGPVASVDEVLATGEVIEPSAYRVDITSGVYLLVRVDGECWPMCQNFTADEGEPGSFSVTYGLGLPLPLALQIATAMLACEYAKALAGGACKLPSKMTRLSRQGVEVELEAPDADSGATGIREVDQVVATLNPSKRQRPPLVLSLDLPESCDRATVIGAGS